MNIFLNRKNQNVKRHEDPKHIDFKIHKEGGLVGDKARKSIQCQVIWGLECKAKRRELRGLVGFY